ncbi:MAG: hypothetical protein LBE38_02360 [Deltaproteobacteria bacterium]|nr:hypothetical protein [Deltaproteobacteria bacterium]
MGLSLFLTLSAKWHLSSSMILDCGMGGGVVLPPYHSLAELKLRYA